MSILPPTKFVDFFVTIAAKLDNESNPNIIYNVAYPSIGSRNIDETLRNIGPFCFAEVQVSINTPTKFHDFVLTNEKGVKRYVSCLRSTEISIKDIAGDVTCFCLVSNRPKFEAMRRILASFLEIIKSNSSQKSAEWLIHRIINEVFLPPAGGPDMTLSIPSQHLRLRFEQSYISCKNLDFDGASIIQAVGYRNLVYIFNLLLLEKSVFLYSSSPTLITRTCEILLAMLYPFQWNLVYVPIVPYILQDLLQAPTPFLMGGHRNWAINAIPGNYGELSTSGDNLNPEKSMRISQDDFNQQLFVKIDLDTGDIFDYYSLNGIKAEELPQRSEILDKINRLFNPSIDYLDQANASVQFSRNSNEMFEKFMSIFHYWTSNALKEVKDFFRADGRFDTAKWILSLPDEHRDFHEKFSQTSLFNNFLERKDGFEQCNVFYENPPIEKLDSANRSSNELSLVIDFDRISRKRVQTMTFDPHIFMQFEKRLPESAQKSLSFVTKNIGRIQNENGNLFWLRAFIGEKNANLLEKDDQISESILQKYAMKSLSDYAKALEFKISSNRDETELILHKAKYLMSKIDGQITEKWIKTLPKNISNYLWTFVNLSNQRLGRQMLELPAKAHMREVSGEPIDRLVLNCNPFYDRYSHLSSNDALESETSNMEIPEGMKKYFTTPVELSVEISRKLASMIRILSVPPEGLAFSSGTLGSLNDLKSISSIVSYMRKDKSKVLKSSLLENFFILEDQSKLKKMKELPTFEEFRKLVYLLRYVRLDDYLINEDDKLCFWLNVRNVICVHAILEFGSPKSMNHRMTFLYHKPVYNISGCLFSINEITYGILKPDQPLPSAFGTKSNQNLAASSNSNLTQKVEAEPSLVQVTTKIKNISIFGSSSEKISSAKNSSNTHLHSSCENLANANTSRITGNQGNFQSMNSRIPLRFANNDYSFGLFDGTKSGPMFHTFYPRETRLQLQNAAVDYIDQYVETGSLDNSVEDMLKTDYSAFTALSIGLGKYQNRGVAIPQFLVTNARDFSCANNIESIVLHLSQIFPNSKLTKFLISEKYIKCPSGRSFLSRVRNDHYHVETPENALKNLNNLTIDKSRPLIIKVRDHCLTFQFKLDLNE